MNRILPPEHFGLLPSLVFIGNFSDTCGETEKQICLWKSPKRFGSAIKIFFATVGQSQRVKNTETGAFILTVLKVLEKLIVIWFT